MGTVPLTEEPRYGLERGGDGGRRTLSVAHRGTEQSLPLEKLAEIREEIGDVMICLTELADKFGIDPTEAAKAKLEIVLAQDSKSPNHLRDNPP